MRNILLVGWLLLPIGVWAYHEGPGQDRLAMEETDAVVQAARSAVDAEKWPEAVRRYEEAIAKLPRTEGLDLTSVERRLRLELNKARMLDAGLPTARTELAELVEQIAKEPGKDAALLDESRQALARAQFYTTWLKRLEGVTREEWEPEIEAARQNYRLLAESATDPTAKAKHLEDLEAAIHLERMQIEDLQGLPLPGE